MITSGLRKSGRYLVASVVLAQEVRQHIATLVNMARAKGLRQMTAIQFRFVMSAMPV